MALVPTSLPWAHLVPFHPDCLKCNFQTEIIVGVCVEGGGGVHLEQGPVAGKAFRVGVGGARRVWIQTISGTYTRVLGGKEAKMSPHGQQGE